MSFEAPQPSRNEAPPIFFGNDPAEKVKLAVNILRKPDADEIHKEQAKQALRSVGIEFDPEMDAKNPEILEGVVQRMAYAKRDSDIVNKRKADEDAARLKEEQLRAKIAEETQRAMAPEQWSAKPKPSFTDRLRGLFG